MIFKINGIAKGPELDAFRNLWADYTEAENGYLTGQVTRGVSSAQQFVIDLFTGDDGPYVEDDMNQADRELETVLPAQMELEALFRARSRALAEMLGRLR